MAYSPTLGRWMQEDPLGYVDGLMLYQARTSNPIALTDPSGLKTIVFEVGPDMDRNYGGRLIESYKKSIRDGIEKVNAMTDEQYNAITHKSVNNGPCKWTKQQMVAFLERELTSEFLRIENTDLERLEKLVREKSQDLKQYDQIVVAVHGTMNQDGTPQMKVNIGGKYYDQKEAISGIKQAMSAHTGLKLVASCFYNPWDEMEALGIVQSHLPANATTQPVSVIGADIDAKKSRINIGTLQLKRILQGAGGKVQIPDDTAPESKMSRPEVRRPATQPSSRPTTSPS